jgi:predicted RNA-binding protein with PUA-like domain
MAPRRRYWLLKSEPSTFSFDDLLTAPKRQTHWDGVRNYQARNLLRDDLAKGDGVLFYHSNADPTAVVGVAKVVRAGYPDFTQFDPEDSHYDASADPEDPRWYMVDIQAVSALPQPVTLAELKSRSKLADMALVQRGQRLSVQPVRTAEWREVLRLGGLEKDVL